MENALQLSVKPDIDKYKKRIEGIENSIREILETAMIDFLMVSSVFKKYSQFAEPSITATEAARISMSIKELQYMDTFGQKLNHIIVLHNLLNSNQVIAHSKNQQGGISADHANFIFKLNYLQATVARYDFTATVTDLQRNLHDLHDHIIEVTRLEFQESDYFKHLNKIDEQLNALALELEAMTSERIGESPLHPSVKDQGMKIANLYTMDSERQVLHWLLKNLDGQVKDIKDIYASDTFSHGEPQIELF